MSNIILIGFMGSGKTSVGMQLAQALGWQFIDMDEIIERMEKTAIREIFKNKGENYFRELESRVVKTLSDYDKFVVSTGGGVILREENVQAMKEAGQLVWLWAEPETVYERIKSQSHRPLLNVPDPLTAIKRILEKRQPLYAAAADLKIDNSSLTIDQTVGKITTCLKLK